jgi:hypothetical protein
MERERVKCLQSLLLRTRRHEKEGEQEESIPIGRKEGEAEKTGPLSFS